LCCTNGPMAAAELGSWAASSMSECAVWYAGVVRVSFSFPPLRIQAQLHT
jgi:hypothetical protein